MSQKGVLLVFIALNRIVLAMAGLRLLSASIELTAALLFLRFNRVEAALRINSVLGLFGPAIFMLVSLFGIAGLSGGVEPIRLAAILCGVALVLWGTAGR